MSIHPKLVLVSLLFSSAVWPGPLTQVDVFRSGEGGYHTYRIPALITTPKGTLLAFCEGRKNSGSDTGDFTCFMGIVREVLSLSAMVISEGELATTVPVTVVPSRITTVAWGLSDDDAASLLAH